MTRDESGAVLSWDDDNRIKSWSSDALTIVMDYDAIGRRIAERIYIASGLSESRCFVWEDWRCVREVDVINNRMLDLTIGKDLAGTLTEAGGVGGTVAIATYDAVQTNVNYVFCDGNGNIRLQYNANTFTATVIQCGPFGESSQENGNLTGGDSYGFSSKRYDPVSTLTYFGYRQYLGRHGRWPTRDPIGEAGGQNLYCFVGNDPINGFDAYGLEKCITDTPSKFELSQSEYLGPVKVNLSLSLNPEHTVCDTCCPDGRRVKDETYKTAIEGALEVSGGPLSWHSGARVGIWRSSIDVWLGIQVFAKTSGQVEGGHKTDKCNGVDYLQGEPICLSVSIGAGISIGGQLSGELQRQIGGRWTTVLSGSLGAYGTGQVQGELKRCYHPTRGWGPGTFCLKYDTSLNLDLFIVNFSIPGPEGEKCWSF
jgi:RHS repeat-associated protein